jgi:UPF0755 protein
MTEINPIDPAVAEMKAQKRKKIRRMILILLGFFLLTALLTFRIWGPNTQTGENGFYLYIPTNSTFETVLDSLKKNEVLHSEWAFKWLAEKKSYTKRIRPGRYHIENAMSNAALINMLRSGRQLPVDVIFNSIRTREQLAGRIGEQLEPDSLDFLKVLNDPEKTAVIGFTPENIMALFIPNTYEVYWNYTPEKFLQRMYDEYNKFWSKDKLQNALQAGLKPHEVMILASIVEQETTKEDEKSRVAGVYINRLKKGIPLEADPTLIFAIGDFTIKRVLNADKQVDSPYNTYKYGGLPPGPICLPSASTIKAVLNYEKHQFIFFCAKEDLSGYHRFARSLEQHNENARKYQAALNGLNIKR